MKPKAIVIAVVFTAIIAGYLLWQKTGTRTEKSLAATPHLSATIQVPVERPSSGRQTNALGDVLTDAQDPQFLNQVLPKAREFFGTLDRLNLNPLAEDLKADDCSKIRITPIPDGFMCRFVIGDGWSARYTQNSSFSGISYFGQRGPDNPNRAISHADTNTLRRLSEGAIQMSKAEAWKVANQVADAFAIDRSKFEEPDMYEEALFDYRLGIQSVQYRNKGSDPINGLNYTRGFSLKAMSPTTSVLVGYYHYEAR